MQRLFYSIRRDVQIGINWLCDTAIASGEARNLRQQTSELISLLLDFGRMK